MNNQFSFPRRRNRNPFLTTPLAVGNPRMFRRNALPNIFPGQNTVLNRQSLSFPLQLNRSQNNMRSNLMNPQFLNANLNRFPVNYQRQRANLLNNNQYFRNRDFNQGRQNYINGGVLASNTYTNDSFAPYSTGFSMANTGERNTPFSKEFVAGFLDITDTDFSSFSITTHPSLNSSVVAISQIYQRYKILSFAFKYKATCATTTTGLHYTGVDYGTQTKIPIDFTEAQTLEHFSVGPIWKDSMDWHFLKLGNLRERWFDINVNSDDPESRPARIIFGSKGANTINPRGGSFGLIEVKVTYLFNGLAQTFTGSPPSKYEENDNLTEEEHESIVNVTV